MLILNSEAPSVSAPKDFFVRQIKINVERVLLARDTQVDDELRRLERDLDQLFQFICVPQFTFKLDDVEWKSISKVFARVAIDMKFSIYETLQEKIVLDEDEKIVYNCFTDQES